MSVPPSAAPNTRDILQARGARNSLDVRRPYAYLAEPEPDSQGVVQNVTTIFLTNRECPFRCLMCDLWKNTTEESIPPGAIPEQIEYALRQLPVSRHIKLYNSGNFFDLCAIHPSDWPAIIRLIDGFSTVIVENHPRLCDERVLRFQRLLPGQLEVALGLETIHPTVLPALNKQMTVDDFCGAVEFLRDHEIDVRCFVLLRPPFLSADEGVVWAIRSIELAWDRGVDCCAVIPTHSGNGIMEQLQRRGEFQPPSLSDLERVAAALLPVRRGRLLMDLWDIHRFWECDACGPARTQRLRNMNLRQSLLPPIACEHCGVETP